MAIANSKQIQEAMGPGLGEGKGTGLPRDYSDYLDDGKGVVMSLLIARQGSSCRAIASYIICFLLLRIFSSLREGSGEGRSFAARGSVLAGRI